MAQMQMPRTRAVTLEQADREEELRNDALRGEPDWRYEAGFEHGHHELLRQIYRRIYLGPHREGCECHACEILETAKTGGEAFLILEDMENTREASRTRVRQSMLMKAPHENPSPELGHGQDTQCTGCRGIPEDCFLDNPNWRLCPHAV